MRSLCVMIAVAGCGFRAGNTGPALDASIDTPGGIDCLARWHDNTVRLTAPAHLSQLGSPQDDRDPFISTDTLTLYYASENLQTSLGGDVFMTTRPSVDAPFGAPVVVSTLSSAQYDAKVTMTLDGMTAVLSSSRVGTVGGADLWHTTRTTLGDSFLAPGRTQFGSINDINDQQDPELSADGLRVYYSVGTPQTIAMASRASLLDDFTNPTGVIGSGAGDADPMFSLDERLVLFASARNGGVNIWYATRASASVPFGGTAFMVPDVNSDFGDGDPTLSRDGCQLFFASNRLGSYEIFYSTVVP